MSHCVRPFQASLSMGFSRKEYWSELSCPYPRDLPNPVMEPMSLASPALAGRFFTTSATWEALVDIANLPFKGYQFIIFLTVFESACLFALDISKISCSRGKTDIVTILNYLIPATVQILRCYCIVCIDVFGF